MPLPLPNLDDRRWSDLVDEGRALIPRYAPQWTDHNVSDPGITLVDLLAWLVEQDIYRVNRVPDRHRRKFLALAGFSARPPQPARVPLAFAPSSGATPVTLPAGTVVASAGIPFRTLASVNVLPVTVQAVLVEDASGLADRTSVWREGLPLPMLGEDPSVPPDPGAGQTSRSNAFYVGFQVDAPLPDGTELSLWLRFRGWGTGEAERRRIIEEVARQAEACLPWQPKWSCPPGDAVPPQDDPGAPDAIELPPHHSARTVWEFFDGTAWQGFSQDAVRDETRSLTLDGPVALALPSSLAPGTFGGVTRPLSWVRCRLEAGRPDSAPILLSIQTNAAPAEQALPARSAMSIAPGVAPSGSPPSAGATGTLQATFDGRSRISSFAFGSGGSLTGPVVTVLGYEPAGAQEGKLTVTAVVAGMGDGAPSTRAVLPGAPVSRGAAEVWVADASGMHKWEPRGDLDAAMRADAVYTLDPTTGEITFGDGDRGRIPPAGGAVLATYHTTVGIAGNVTAGTGWKLRGADDVSNRILLGLTDQLLRDLSDGLTIVSPVSASGGEAEEDLEHAEGRAAAALWTHERLVDLCPAGACRTLDQLDPADVLARTPPERAATLLDFERLAHSAPGTAVARARAWAGMDPSHPCLKAPGTVTVVIVPELPRGRPQPTTGLLAAVRRYLSPRRVVGTRLVVVGPGYVEVAVRAAVQTSIGANAVRVRQDVTNALDAFLDPLRGGPNGRGWPFGRDVYRSEILQQIDQVPGVDHVTSIELDAGPGTVGCSNVCVGPTFLVTPGAHSIEVR